MAVRRSALAEIYPLSLHDALPISVFGLLPQLVQGAEHRGAVLAGVQLDVIADPIGGEQPDETGCADPLLGDEPVEHRLRVDRKSTRLDSSHSQVSYAVFCLKRKLE